MPNFKPPFEVPSSLLSPSKKDKRPFRALLSELGIEPPENRREGTPAEPRRKITEFFTGTPGPSGRRIKRGQVGGLGRNLLRPDGPNR